MNPAAIILFLCISSVYSLKESRIIGGSIARAGQFPWQAAIYLDNVSGRYFCGGALVTNQWLLTAAHCVYGGRSFTIHLGSTTLLASDPNRVILSSSTYTVHPQYNQNTLENDIGLIRLREPVTLTEYIQPIELANTGLIESGTIVTAAGFGQTSDSAAGIANNLNYVDLVIISNLECQVTYGSQIKVGMVCAVGTYNEGICIGDTGSPLVLTDENGHGIHVGVASFMSNNGCESLDPTGYTRTDIYHEWISNITSAA